MSSRSFGWMSTGITVILVMVMFTGCISFTTKEKSPSAGLAAGHTTDHPELPLKTQVTQEELQSAVISYANRFIAIVSQASLIFEQELPTPKARVMASNRRVYSLLAATEIAAGPKPGAALLDMVVITSLSRMVWDEYWRPQIFGTPATVIVDAFATLEKDIWYQASLVMTPEQMEELRSLINTWRADHPEQFVVDYIRFSDFGSLGKKPNLKEIQKPGGLLAPIRDATKAVDEARMTSERAMFLLTKMQLITNFQVELAYKNMMFQPEARNLMKNMDQFSLTANDLARFLETFPSQISIERQAAFDDAARLISNERKATLEEVSGLIAREREAFLSSLKTEDARIILRDVNLTLERMDKSFAQLRTTLSMADQVVQGSEKTGMIFKDLMLSADQLANRLLPEDASSPGKSFDINDYTRAMRQLEVSTEKLNTLLTSANTAAEELTGSILNDFNNATEKRVDHIFFRLVELCLVSGLVVLILIIVNYRIRRNRAK